MTVGLAGPVGPPHILIDYASVPILLQREAWGVIITTVEPEERHRCCWYGRRTADLPDDLGLHTIVDGQLLYCAYPMYWPVVRYEFDLRNCEDCDVFKARRSERPPLTEAGE